jgi:hypothetical protein
MASQIMEFIKEILSSLLANGVQGKIGAEISFPIEEPKEVMKSAIDWADAKSHITPHFTVGDAIMLHSWNRLATDEDGLTDDGKAKLIVLCQKIEEVRTHLNCAINVHCMFRSQKYNQEVVKAIPNDVHAQFLAVDFDCSPTLTIQQIKDKMEPVLESMGLRMEKGTTTWVHLDLRAPGPSGRYFTA